MQRPLKITTDFITTPEGSVLIETGNTKVICNVTIEKNVPPFLKDSGQGWVTAEYGMLPRSTKERTKREASAGKITGRTAEIQRLIGRALRAVVDMRLMDGFTATIDCDVIQADGGTRTAAISGAALALYIAFEKAVRKEVFTQNPMKELIAAISVGIVDNEIEIDLDYQKDSTAQVDMNVVMTESGNYVEVQGTGERSTFNKDQLQGMLHMAQIAIQSIINYQREVINNYVYQ